MYPGLGTEGQYADFSIEALELSKKAASFILDKADVTANHDLENAIVMELFMFLHFKAQMADPGISMAYIAVLSHRDIEDAKNDLAPMFEHRYNFYVQSPDSVGSLAYFLMHRLNEESNIRIHDEVGLRAVLEGVSIHIANLMNFFLSKSSIKRMPFSKFRRLVEQSIFSST